MSAIRPDLPAFGQNATPTTGAGAREAQAAFFRAALGQTGAAAPAPTPRLAAARASTTQAQPSQAHPPQALAPQITPTAQAAPATEPDRSLRPGSLLDIRI